MASVYVFLSPEEVLTQLWLGKTDITLLDEGTRQHITFQNQNGNVKWTTECEEINQLGARIVKTHKHIMQLCTKNDLLFADIQDLDVWRKVQKLIPACYVLSEFN